MGYSKARVLEERVPGRAYRRGLELLSQAGDNLQRDGRLGQPHASGR